jgi:glycosyltransferase involved in cell wall biosynthesis
MLATLREHHPGASFTVLVLDADLEALGISDELPGLPGGRVLGMAEVLGANYGLLAAANAPAALDMAVLPHLVHAVFAAGEQSLIYVGAGQRIVGPMSELLELVDAHEVAVVARPTSRAGTLVAAPEVGRGAFSRQLIGLRAGRSVDALLAAWPRYFTSAGDGGTESIRGWIDSIPARVADVGVLHHAGYGLDPSSLSKVELSKMAAADGPNAVLEANGAPVRVVDFSELDPGAPSAWIDAHQQLRLSGAPVLAALVEHQVADLQAAGMTADATSGQDASIPYVRLDDGLLLGETVRSLLVDGILAGEVKRSPFSDAGRAELYRYLNKPYGRGQGAGLTRLHMAIWERRADLRGSYPHIDGPDGAGFAGWLCLHGTQQEGLVPELLPPTPELAYRDADPHVHENPPRWGVNVVGFFTAELGVGEAARLLVAGLDAASIPTLPIQGQLLPPSRREHEFDYAQIDEAAYPINIICINGDGIPVFAREAGRSFFADRYTIALWFWEVGDPPASWSPAYEFVDEVWVVSQHAYDVIAPVSPVPVVHVTLPLVVPELVPATRAELGMPEQGFVFLYIHDYHSVAARKNPLGHIEAFRRAFPMGSGAKLVLKSTNADTHPQEHERVTLAAGGREDITLIDGYLSSAEKNSMIAACDCYVSLHRAEGFGLTVAEAMLLGKPVIATRHGGTLEFMNDRNSYLVGWEPVAVGEGAYPYAADALWAEPDLGCAAALMRHVFEARDEAEERGHAARRELAERHSAPAAGATMKRRLAVVHERLIERGERTLNLAQLPALSPREEMRQVSGAPPALEWRRDRLGRLKSLVYRPVVNWARAYVKHQAILEQETRATVTRLDDGLREVARTVHDEHNAQHAETLAVLRRLEAELAGLRRRLDGLDD